MRMTDGDSIKVYYTSKFRRELKEASKKNPNILDAVDDLIEALRLGREGKSKAFNMPDKCKGFNVIEDKCLNIKGGHNIGGGSRSLHTRYNNHILFLRYFFKNQMEKLDLKEKKTICMNLQSVKNGTCQDTFFKVRKPLIRSILDDEDK